MEFSNLYDVFVDAIKIIASYVTSPTKRVFVVYLITTALIAFFVFKKDKLKGSFFTYVFNKKVWLGESAIVDYVLIIFNAFFKVIILAPFFLIAYKLAFFTQHLLLSNFGIADFGFSSYQIIIAYTLAIVVLNDFVTYVLHLIMHKVPFLWEFHKVHHSATSLSPFTQYRIHPVELLINNIGEVVGKGCLTGLFMYVASGKVSLITFLGVNVLNFFFYFFGANLRHSHVKLKYFNFLEHLVISPFQHQIHHSNKREHFDTNLGSRFAVWDWMFGTLKTSKNVGKIEFGLGKQEDVEYNTFSKNLFNPFKRLWKSFF